MKEEIEKIIKKEIKKLEKRREFLQGKKEYYYQFRKVTREEVNFELESIQKRLNSLYQFLEDRKITRYIKTVLITSIELELAKIYDKLYPDGVIFNKREDKKLIERKEKLLKLLEKIKEKEVK